MELHGWNNAATQQASSGRTMDDLSELSAETSGGTKRVFQWRDA